MIDVALGIAAEVLPPILILVGLGVLLDRLCSVDLETLCTCAFHLFVPALVFDKVLTAELDWQAFAAIAGFALLHLLAMGLCAAPVWLRGAWRAQAPVSSLGAMFFNAGNIGLPVASIAFGADGVAAMAIILMVQNLASFTLGIVLVEAGRRRETGLLLGLARIPVVWAIAAALALRALAWSPPAAIMLPIGHLAAALVPVALITLGVQFARCNVRGARPLEGVTIALRLVVSPLVAAGLTCLFALPPATRALCICAAGMPVAVNVFLIASTYGRDAAAASRIVFWSTVLSAASLPLLIALAR